MKCLLPRLKARRLEKQKQKQNHGKNGPLLDCYLTAKKEMEWRKQSSSFSFMAVNKEKDKIVVCEMAKNGLTHWNLKQATTKYNNILKEFRGALTKLK